MKDVKMGMVDFGKKLVDELQNQNEHQNSRFTKLAKVSESNMYNLVLLLIFCYLIHYILVW